MLGELAGYQAAAMAEALVGSPRGAGAAPRRCCLRATVALWLCAAGALLSAACGIVARGGEPQAGAGGLFTAAALFVVLAIMAMFQRSLERQVLRFDEENDELRATRARLDQENLEFDAANRLLRAQVESAGAENAAFHASNVRLAQNAQGLEASLAAAAAQNAEQKKGLAHLNKLHNDSVAMIRQLALYGDECRSFGKDLKDVASELRETDDSLGLTAGELRQQAAAIQAATAALVAAAGPRAAPAAL